MYWGYTGLKCTEKCGNCLTSFCQFPDGKCDSCNSTFWGETCNFTCDVNCANPSNGACLQKDGSCLLCLNGFYGPNCKDKCPDNCLDGYCDKETGDCNCSYGHWGVKCEYN